MQKKLYIVANRLPVTIIQHKGQTEISSASGGLVSAISSYLQATAHEGQSFDAVLWAGVPGCTAKVWQRVKQKIQQNGYTYLPVFTERRLYDRYYNGFCNSLLWPLFHYFPSYAEFRASDYEAYMEVNRQFHMCLAEQLEDQDTVWIHDYHLLPLAGMLRRSHPNLTIGFFLHIPFPPYDIFKMLPWPWQQSILDGLCGSNLLGFHTIHYANNFIQCAQTALGAESRGRHLMVNGRIIRVGVFPISIDYKKFNNSYTQDPVERLRRSYRQQIGDRKIIFSVDRLDYTKGVMNRLKAYERFLATNPEYEGKVVFVMVIVPSRDTISKYDERKKMINEFAGYLNGKFGGLQWQPLLYNYNSISFEELCALYTVCNLALITPLRDGMNLVAKEFVASRRDKKGVLILSEMAGASEELVDALLINPNDQAEISRAIKTALEMPDDEQEIRMTHMQKRIQQYDVQHWAADFMLRLQEAHAAQEGMQIRIADEQVLKQLQSHYLAADRRLLLFDYDGTLVNFAAQPDLAIPTADLLQLLNTLAQNTANTLCIISGRPAYSLERWFKHLRVNLIAEHGAAIKLAGEEWQTPLIADTYWMAELKEVINRYVDLYPNSFLETKQFSLAWHYRNTTIEAGSKELNEIASQFSEHLHTFDLQLLKGNKVMEIRPAAISKGTAVRQWLARISPDFVLAVGDDATDEDMFRVLKNHPHSISLKVGYQVSAADYNLKDTAEVKVLLQALAKAGTRMAGN